MTPTVIAEFLAPERYTEYVEVDGRDLEMARRLVGRTLALIGVQREYVGAAAAAQRAMNAREAELAAWGWPTESDPYWTDLHGQWRRLLDRALAAQAALARIDKLGRDVERDAAP